jgi:hypothetical protein
MRGLYARYRRLNDWFRAHPIADDILMAASCGVGVAIAAIVVAAYSLSTALAVGGITFLVGVPIRIGIYRRQRVTAALKRIYGALRART